MQIIKRLPKASLIQRVAGVLAMLITLGAVAQGPIVRLSEPVAKDQVSETFGSVWEARPALSLTEVLTNVERYAGQPVVIKTSIAKVCQKKGCFFIAQEGSLSVRVSFRDYGFFIPTDASGKVVVLAGELVKTELSQQQAEHFSADAGEPGAISAGTVVELIADGIRIPIAAS